MQIISRAQLFATLTGPVFSPDGDRKEEMSAFATAILNHAPAAVTHFVFTDHENGDDQTVTWSEYDQLHKEELIPLTYAAVGDYYGLTAARKEWNPEDLRWLYQCFLGGCAIQSAPGFVISTAIMVA